MSEVDKGELLLAPFCIAMSLLPLWPLYKANKQGVSNVGHLINRYTMWFLFEMVLVLLLGYAFTAVNDDVARFFIMIAYCCLVFAVFPIMAILLINILYLFVFAVRKKYKVEGWDIKGMTIGRKSAYNA